MPIFRYNWHALLRFLKCPEGGRIPRKHLSNRLYFLLSFGNSPERNIIYMKRVACSVASFKFSLTSSSQLGLQPVLLFTRASPNFFLHYPKLLMRNSFLPHRKVLPVFKCPCCDWIYPKINHFYPIWDSLPRSGKHWFSLHYDSSDHFS